MSEKSGAMDTMTDGATTGRPFTAQRGRKLPVSGGSLVLAAMFAVAVSAVYLLNLRVTPDTADAEETSAERQVDLAIGMWGGAGPGASAGDSSQSLVESFYKDTRQRQIPLHELPDNPFAFVPPKGESEDVKQSGSRRDTGQPVSRDRQHDNALTLVQGLELQSISTRRDGTSVAMISDYLVTVGQDINGWTVTRIEPRHVVLTWGKETFDLWMAD
jgi:hypothetical protein